MATTTKDYEGVLMRIFLLSAYCCWICGITTVFAQPIVISLTQTACQFIESEKQDYGFISHQAEDCVQINKTTETKRLHDVKALVLKSGTYIFRVLNRDVPYRLAFWLRGKGLGRITLPSVSGGGIHAGESRDYTITLEKGEYLYSCPLNPTPDYRLLVE